MADFYPALEKVLGHEGGYVNDPGDPGGETYKGIARKIHGNWDGWAQIDTLKSQPLFPSSLDEDAGLQSKIEEFYRTQFWNRVKGNEIGNQEVAASIFDFAVNAGVSTSVSLAQKIVGATPDGIAGNETAGKINSFNPGHFLAAFAVAKINRYISIVEKRPESRKYFYGWVCRAISGI